MSRFYDYKCSKGHVFERFEKTESPTTTTCDICEKDPGQTEPVEAKRIITTARIGKLNQIKDAWLDRRERR